MTSRNEQLLAELLGGPAARPALASTAERVADLLRGHLTEGRIDPGTRMSEEAFAKAFSVSRNTLREAFRLLGHEGLLVHEHNRGVFVRRLSREDVNDIYDLREMLELHAVRHARTHTPEALAELHRALVEGRSAAASGDVRLLGTRTLEFHRCLARLAGSERIDKMMRGLLAEARLAFAVMTRTESFDSPFQDENEEIYDHLVAGRTEEAAAIVARYLAGARQQLLDAFDAEEEAAQA